MKRSLLRTARPGFSLTELLIVMAILGVAFALIYPALQRTRQKTATTECTAKLRQLAFAHRMYEQEHRGQPPPNFFQSSHPYSEGHSGDGVTFLRRYLRTSPDNRFTWSASHTYLVDPIDFCPSVRFNGLSTNLTHGADYQMSSLSGINYGAYYQEPSRRPLFWDGFQRVWSSGNHLVPLRHHNGILCVFLDGHVEWISQGDGRLYHRWWHYAINDPAPNDSHLHSGKPMGSSRLPSND